MIRYEAERELIPAKVLLNAFDRSTSIVTRSDSPVEIAPRNVEPIIAEQFDPEATDLGGLVYLAS